MPDVAALLEGPEFFRCERFATVMRRAVCAARQMAKSNLRWDAYPECRGCEQGREIIENFGLEGDKMTDTVMCRECHVRPALLKKDGDPVAHRLCRECFGGKLRAGRAKRDKLMEKKEKEERKAELAEASAVPARGNTVLLDFKGREELLEKLRAHAEAGFRSVELDIMFLAREGMEAGF